MRSGGNNFDYFSEFIIFIFNKKIEIVGLCFLFVHVHASVYADLDRINVLHWLLPSEKLVDGALPSWMHTCILQITDSAPWFFLRLWRFINHLLTYIYLLVTFIRHKGRQQYSKTGSKYCCLYLTVLFICVWCFCDWHLQLNTYMFRLFGQRGIRQRVLQVVRWRAGTESQGPRLRARSYELTQQQRRTKGQQVHFLWPIILLPAFLYDYGTICAVSLVAESS